MYTLMICLSQDELLLFSSFLCFLVALLLYYLLMTDVR